MAVADIGAPHGAAAYRSLTPSPGLAEEFCYGASLRASHGRRRFQRRLGKAARCAVGRGRAARDAAATRGAERERRDAAAALRTATAAVRARCRHAAAALHGLCRHAATSRAAATASPSAAAPATPRSGQLTASATGCAELGVVERNAATAAQRPPARAVISAGSRARAHPVGHRAEHPRTPCCGGARNLAARTRVAAQAE